jgi:hypothetical protein
MRRTLFTAAGWIAFLSAIYIVLGFRPAQPDSIGAGEVCYRCRRVIADARLAAETMDRNLPTKYRTAGCMARYAAAHPRTGSRYYVTDSASGTLVAAERAFFVPTLLDDTTGERDYRAFVSKVMAEHAAHVSGSDVVNWTTVVARAQS